MLGIDVGGTKIELAIFNENVELIESWRVSTPKNDYEQFLQTITQMVADADEKLSKKETVGIGIPGFVDRSGRAISANVPCITGRIPSLDLPKRIDRPVATDSDTKNFVYSEANGGAGAGYRHVLGLILGTGLSGNFSIGGVLSRGANSQAGEYGHLSLPTLLGREYDFPLLECGCGKVGCAEKYLSGPGLLWMSRFFGGHYNSVVDLMEDQQKAGSSAAVAFSAYIDCLGAFLAHMTLILDPDVIVLGGGLSNIPQIYQELPESMERHLVAGFGVPDIVAPLYGDSSGVRGAAMLGRQCRDNQID